MQIKLSPVRAQATLALERLGDVLTINGESFDFTNLVDGGVLPQGAVSCEFLRSDVRRIDGKLHLSLALPHGGNAAHETRFPADIIDPPDGIIALPGYEIQEEGDEDEH